MDKSAAVAADCGAKGPGRLGTAGSGARRAGARRAGGCFQPQRPAPLETAARRREKARRHEAEATPAKAAGGLAARAAVNETSEAGELGRGARTGFCGVAVKRPGA